MTACELLLDVIESAKPKHALRFSEKFRNLKFQRKSSSANPATAPKGNIENCIPDTLEESSSEKAKLFCKSARRQGTLDTPEGPCVASTSKSAQSKPKPMPKPAYRGANTTKDPSAGDNPKGKARSTGRTLTQKRDNNGVQC